MCVLEYSSGRDVRGPGFPSKREALLRSLSTVFAKLVTSLHIASKFGCGSALQHMARPSFGNSSCCGGEEIRCAAFRQGGMCWWGG
jgi:hypothetical protein